MHCSSGRNGSALLIILAFVLLLTVITTFFLSKALQEKTVSSASSDQTRTDLFAAGAVDAILSDCQQEIAAGSGTITSTLYGSTNVTIYTPTAQTIVPSRTWQSAQVTQPNPMPNLLKRSACTLTFYPTGSMYGAGNYTYATTYPPHEKTFTTADTNDSTSAVSLNGRSYTATRWNQPLLLPPASGTYTSANSSTLTPTSSFTVPDWILVQRDGTNPTGPWSKTMCTAAPGDVTTANKNPVVGRYAYTIYDEGGLLDMNVTGFASSSAAANNLKAIRYYRMSLASVDLTQLASSASATPFLPSSSSTAPINTDINSIVGWRNYATLQATGTIPNYTFSSASAITNYFQNVQPPGTAFMHPTVPPSISSFSVTTGQSDKKFSSRQQLINLLLNDVAQTSAEKASLQNALQYMGTFSRDLNQPSYSPDANRPRMAAATGSLTSDPASTGGNASASDDANNYINVPFASTLVTTSFTRADGSTAMPGDPLVKRRFALNRLAWLTYLGPIATDSGTYNTATGITTLVTALKTKYGYTDAFLLQGGPTNIKNYFGLLWAADANDNNRSKWFYNGSTSSSPADGATFSSNHTTTYNGVTKITELGGGSYGMFSGNNAGPHDPDFFELIKAAILAGSKGKTLTYLTAPNISTDPLHPWNVQSNYDVSLDYQVLQIGANIIDQSRIDGYTTEIVFDNNAGGGPYEVRGVENYPYLYRIREGAMTFRKINPATAVVPDNQSKVGLNSATYPTFTDTGVAALMQVPEVWNPHDVNAPMGSPYPYYFRIVMDSTTPANLATATPSSSLYSSISIAGEDTPSGASGTDSVTLLNPLSTAQATTPTGTAGSPPYFSTTPSGTISLSGGYGGENQTFTPANTSLTFRVPNISSSGAVTTPNSTVFREPTMLSRPGLPTGSSLALGWTPPTGSDLALVQNSTGTMVFNGTGFYSDTPNPLNLPTAPATTQTYLGFVLGLYPIQWVHSFGTPSAANNYIYDSTVAHINPSPNAYFTYRMQYADPVLNPTGTSTLPWVTYDVKYMTPKAKWPSTPGVSGPGSIVNPNKNTAFYGSDSWQSYADPRTSRFGAPGGDNNGTVTYFAQPGVSSQEWMDQNNGVLYTDRPDHKQGFDFESNRGGDGWYLNACFSPGWNSTAAAGYNGFRWGPITQNTIATTTDATVIRYTGDTGNSTGTFQPYYYADADGVVRRAMGGQVPLNSATAPTYFIGYPMAPATVGYNFVASTYQGGATVQSFQSESRPYILKRPFRSVAELGYVFSGTPWKNLDFSNPESGDSPLLDVFCISDTDDPNGLVAGKVNLNTQQIPVLAAILAEAYYNEFDPNNQNLTGGYINTSDALLTSGSAYNTAAFSLASYLVNGPSGTSGTAVTPLMNMRELVGKYSGSATTAGTMGIDGTSPSNYTGYSSDIATFYNPTSGAGASYFNGYQTRFREAAVRALSAVGETRVWNLMIDVVAQTGRYPSSAQNAANFMVEGERRYWVHVAIDRYTGKILDRQIEEVHQ